MQAAQLPLWVEYVKVLGAPLIALIAAGIAGVIAYRQWVTARNKLKLDFFDRRLLVYKKAIAVIVWMGNPQDGKDRLIDELVEAHASSRWLFGPEVAEHLKDLISRAIRIPQEPTRNYRYGSREEQLVAINNAVERAKTVGSTEIGALERIFAPYLTVQH